MICSQNGTGIPTKCIIIRSTLENQTCGTWNKVFKSAAPTQFWRNNQNKNCFETRIAKGLIFWVYKIDIYFCHHFSWTFLHSVLEKFDFLPEKYIFTFLYTPYIKPYGLLVSEQFCFGCTFKTELWQHFWSLCTSKWP